MGDDRDPAVPVPLADEANGPLQLSAGVRGAAEGRCFLCRPLHLGIGIAKPAEAVKVERPDVEPGRAQLVAPGPPVKSTRDRQNRGKSAALYIKHDPGPHTDAGVTT